MECRGRKVVSCVHHVPGRARFKLEALRRDPELADRLLAEVGALQGVDEVEINRHAASVIVYYSTATGQLTSIMDLICSHCPKSSLNHRAETAAGPTAAAATPRTGDTPRGAQPKVARAVGEAVSRALVNTLINRALDRGLTTMKIGLR